MTELPEIPRSEAVVELTAAPRAEGPDVEMQELPESPEELARREGVHERIRVELFHETKEAEAFAEEHLETPPQW